MPYGYCGKILHVDLTAGNTTVEEPDELFYRRYMGGKGFAGYYLNKLIPAGADPLSPENVLVFAASVLVGAPGPGMSRHTVAAKSPLTGGWGESEAGGWWAAELKFAGFDAVVIRGRSAQPVYLWIHDGEAELRLAAHLWGFTTGECEQAIRNELGDLKVRVAQIGPGGEKMVRYACIVNELRHFNGRTGMGAVMGSKLLKAIAVRGHGKVAVKDPQTLAELTREFSKQVETQPSTRFFRDFGTPGLTSGLNAAGILPTRNFNSGSFEGSGKIEWEGYKKFYTGSGTCYACAVRCKREIAVDDPRFEVDSRYGGPEYETVGAFGANCGVDDLPAIFKANEICNRYTVDTISAGAAISFAMECYENGLLTDADTGGLKLIFGNSEAMLALLQQIVDREGLGDLLAEGTKRAAQKIGRGAERFALTVKGQELPMHEPRGKLAVAIGYCLSDTGADHMTAGHDSSFNLKESISVKTMAPLGVLEPVEIFDLGWKKARLYYYAENVWTLYKVLGICLFPWAPRTFQPFGNFEKMFEAVTGWESSMFELMKAAERAVAMSRMFNARCGFGRQDDRLPKRFLEPMESGIAKGRGVPEEAFQATIDLIYEMKGWDPATARPTRAKLLELELDWLAEMVEA